MTMKKRILTAIFAGFGILMLILDSRTAISGAQNGIELCFYSVIPSLFPFIVLTSILCPVIGGGNSHLLRPLGRLLGIPNGSEGLFLTGILGGYPTGALAVHQAWRNGQLRKEDARRMLAFCSNAGPAFLFGILETKFPQIWMLWVLWGIHILSALLVGMILPGRNYAPNSVSSLSPPTLTQAVKSGVVTMGFICGWIVLFRVILAFCDSWFLWLLPQSVQVSFYSLLELANGCCALNRVASVGARFVLCSTMLAFGGICVLMQTASVTGKLGLGLYLPGKILQALFSLLLSYLIQLVCFAKADQVEIPPVILIIGAIFVTFLAIIHRKRKIRGSIPQLFGV
jgi:hypothetical protein